MPDTKTTVHELELEGDCLPDMEIPRDVIGMIVQEMARDDSRRLEMMNHADVCPACYAHLRAAVLISSVRASGVPRDVAECAMMAAVRVAYEAESDELPARADLH